MSRGGKPPGRRIGLLLVLGVFAGGALINVLAALDEPEREAVTAVDGLPLAPDWPAIAAWPAEDAEGAVEARPDPERATTVIVLDDSSSMRDRMDAAKAAVTEAAALLPETGRLGVLALNAGVVQAPAPAGQVAPALGSALAPIRADGGTPLGPALLAARALLEAEAARQRGFGTYRIIVTTDGAADDADRLARAVAGILTETPIQISTIGIDLGEGHVLNLPGHVSYVGVADVSGLAAALAAAVAENPTFEPITAFEPDEEDT